MAYFTIFLNCFLAKSIAIHVDRADDGWQEINGDELENNDEEKSAKAATVTSIPSKLKATIQFGYEDGMKEALGGEDIDSWIAAAFTHTQTHYRHAESLGTTIEFEVFWINKCKIVSNVVFIPIFEWHL